MKQQTVLILYAIGSVVAVSVFTLNKVLVLDSDSDAVPSKLFNIRDHLLLL